MQVRKKKSESSYFHVRLYHFLIDYHPQLIEDDSWMKERCDIAEDVYINRVLNGNSPHFALEAAHKELFHGLEFSLYRLIIDLLQENFEEEVPDDGTKPLALSLLPICQEVYDTYSFHEDDIESDLLYPAFKLELLGTITTYLEKHGLQQETTPT